MARWIVIVLYFMAVCLAAFSLRQLDHAGRWFALGLLGAILACNLVIWLLQKITLPKAQSSLDEAVARRDGPAFGKFIIRREMARIIQPVGGIALTAGLVLVVIVLRRWHS